MKNSLTFKNACYFNPITLTWRRIHEFEIVDGMVSSLRDQDISDGELATCTQYLIPGFIDAHCHLLENPYNTETIESINEICIRSLIHCARRNLLDACKSGITTLKDMGGRFFFSIDVSNMLKNQQLPMMLTSGCYFTNSGGHCSDRGAIIINEITEFKTHINYLCVSGIKYCKIIHGDEGFDKDLLAQMIQYAHSKDMIVSCHAYTEKAAFEAVLAGTDTLEHAGDYSDNLLDEILKRNVVIIPTYVAAKDSTAENCDILNDVTAQVIQQWYNGEVKVLPKIFERNILVALGSDSGFPGTPCNSVIRELVNLSCDFDIPFDKLLYSAYIITPKALGLNDKLGQIASGYFANFSIYNENPFANLQILGNPTEVWIEGIKVMDTHEESAVIKQLEINDITTILSFVSDRSFDCAGLEDFWHRDELVDWVNNSTDYCIGAFIQDQLVGFCLSHYHEEVHKVHIENVYTLDSYRNKGIANLLIKDVIAHYSDKVPFVRFVALVDSDNIASIQLLLKNSFISGKKMSWIQRNVENCD